MFEQIQNIFIAKLQSISKTVKDMELSPEINIVKNWKITEFLSSMNNSQLNQQQKTQKISTQTQTTEIATSNQKMQIFPYSKNQTPKSISSGIIERIEISDFKFTNSTKNSNTEINSTKSAHFPNSPEFSNICSLDSTPPSTTHQNIELSSRCSENTLNSHCIAGEHIKHKMDEREDDSHTNTSSGDSIQLTNPHNNRNFNFNMDRPINASPNNNGTVQSMSHMQNGNTINSHINHIPNIIIKNPLPIYSNDIQSHSHSQSQSQSQAQLYSHSPPSIPSHHNNRNISISPNKSLNINITNPPPQIHNYVKLLFSYL